MVYLDKYAEFSCAGLKRVNANMILKPETINV